MARRTPIAIDRPLSLTAAAAMLGISTDTIARWIARGKIKAMVYTTGTKRIAESEVARVKGEASTAERPVVQPE